MKNVAAVNDSPRIVIVVGAARSGTKLLRDCLGAAAGVSVVPYDVNFLWRLGNERARSDELTAEMATAKVVRRVRRAILDFAVEPVLVEKTVSNALRVPFVHRVFPEARFIHLVRHGGDVVESAMRQWQAKPDYRYLVQKARSVPIRYSPGYFGRYALDAVRSTLPGSRIPVWGPAYEGISDDLAMKGLLYVCAEQWRHSVTQASLALEKLSLPNERLAEVRYEDLVDNAGRTMSDIAASIEVDTRNVLDEISIRSDRVRRRERFDKSERAALGSYLNETLLSLGYEPI